MPDYTLIIGNKNYSSWSLRPWLWMKHVGLDFTEKRIALFEENTDELLSPYFSDYKVPILLDGELTVWDSLAILEYLAEKHPDKHGWPEDERARAVARSVSAEMHSGFARLRAALPMNCRRRFDDFPVSYDVLKEIQRVQAIWAYCRKKFGENGPWLFGDFSIADAMYAPVALRFLGYDIKVDDISRQYMTHVSLHADIKDWIEAAMAEKEVIAADEVN